MKLQAFIVGLACATTSAFTSAQQLEITVTNLTHGIHFTPILIGAHDDSMHVFKVGEQASAQLQMMAEGGDISGLSQMLSSSNADVVENPAAGLLAPTMSTTTMLNTADSNSYLSVVAMMLPTNDGFIGVNSWMIPTEPGSYTFNVNAYDAGTEANDEIINGGGAVGTPGIPIAPGGNGGSGASGVTMDETTPYVHIHRGSLGDDDLTAGKSDLDNTVHRWLNPVARITVVVN
ncbi:spondin domain-containing protein [Thalassotalea sp. G2M2-11]|uniref:spondin domain-containing protein n=1 Tax=Thalassotalea sp. G2M2-11 TaxID=2787627 RepID=UPI001F49CF70|nr:spondin domain-containing protein [Thalassotalea sp. G2M2-11]